MPQILSHYTLLAQYNQWMNEKIYAAASELSQEALWRDRGAFFKSIGGTLNHLMVADTIWLRRFAAALPEVAALQAVSALAQPSGLDAILFDDVTELRAARVALDDIIVSAMAELDESLLARPISYRNMRGESHAKYLSQLLLHFFNHQTHHRGQITTLLSQAGQDVGVTDLLVLVPGAD